jgi:hypothetical protein
LADDPLNAKPTADDPVEAKVKRLTGRELSAIALPKDGGQVVFSVTQSSALTDREELNGL